MPFFELQKYIENSLYYYLTSLENNNIVITTCSLGPVG
jgi:hypothetical protein